MSSLDSQIDQLHAYVQDALNQGKLGGTEGFNTACNDVAEVLLELKPAAKAHLIGIFSDAAQLAPFGLGSGIGGTSMASGLNADFENLLRVIWHTVLLNPMDMVLPDTYPAPAPPAEGEEAPPVQQTKLELLYVQWLASGAWAPLATALFYTLYVQRLVLLEDTINDNEDFTLLALPEVGDRLAQTIYRLIDGQ